jgi:hypothetical protein
MLHRLAPGGFGFGDYHYTANEIENLCAPRSVCDRIPRRLGKSPDGHGVDRAGVAEREIPTTES